METVRWFRAVLKTVKPGGLNIQTGRMHKNGDIAKANKKNAITPNCVIFTIIQFFLLSNIYLYKTNDLNGTG